MADTFVLAEKFQQLADYLTLIGADASSLCEQVGLDHASLLDCAPDTQIPALQYSRFYLRSVEWMEAKHPAIPWAAGMGAGSFRLMCQCMIPCKTLGEALQRATEFCELTAPLFGHHLQLEIDEGSDRAILAYDFRDQHARAIFSPDNWSRAEHFQTVALSSGLRTWNSIAGWLIGQSIDNHEVCIAASAVNQGYSRMLELTFNAPVRFDQPRNALYLEASNLQLPVVQTPETLEQFLQFVLYQFWITEQSRLTTTMAIKSMIGNLPAGELPSFAELASRLHMSSSTLRRRLIQEDTSYQTIKDECRKISALELLSNPRIKIDEVAERLGFAETSSFIRAFKKWTGMTPRAFRQSSSVYQSRDN